MALDLTRTAPPPPARRTQASQAAQARTQKAVEERFTERVEGVQGVFQVICLPLVFTGQHADAAAITEHAPNISVELVKLGETNENVGALVDRICALGPFGGIIAATMPLLLQILVNHGRLPMSPMLQSVGVQDPAVLLADMQRKALEQQRDMMEQQRQAQEQIARMTAEMQAMQQQGQQEQPAA